MGDIVEENDPSKVRIPMYGTGNPVTRKKLVMIRKSDFFVVKQLSGSHSLFLTLITTTLEDKFNFNKNNLCHHLY